MRMFIGNTFNIGINLSLGDMELGLDFINNSPDLSEGKKDNMEIMGESLECSDIDTDNITNSEENSEGEGAFEWEDEPEEGNGEEDGDIEWEDEPDETGDTEENSDGIDWEDEPDNEETFSWEDEPEETGDKQEEKESDSISWEDEPDEPDDEAFSQEDETDEEIAELEEKIDKALVIKKLSVDEETASRAADIKARELALKEKELALKEKELELKLRQLEIGSNKEVSTEINSQVTEEKPIAKIDTEAQRLALIKKYSVMSQDILYRYVKGFMLKNGVKSHPIDGKLLNNKFGADNINKLIKKSYLIKLSGNCITCNR